MRKHAWLYATPKRPVAHSILPAVQEPQSNWHQPPGPSNVGCTNPQSISQLVPVGVAIKQASLLTQELASLLIPLAPAAHSINEGTQMGSLLFPKSENHEVSMMDGQMNTAHRLMVTGQTQMQGFTKRTGSETNESLLSALDAPLVDVEVLDRAVESLIPKKERGQKRPCSLTLEKDVHKMQRLDSDDDDFDLTGFSKQKPHSSIYWETMLLSNDDPGTKQLNKTDKLNAIVNDLLLPLDNEKCNTGSSVIQTPKEISFFQPMQSFVGPLTPDSDRGQSVRKPLSVITSEPLIVPDILTPDASPLSSPETFTYQFHCDEFEKEAISVLSTPDMDQLFRDVESIIENDFNKTTSPTTLLSELRSLLTNKARRSKKPPAPANILLDVSGIKIEDNLSPGTSFSNETSEVKSHCLLAENIIKVVDLYKSGQVCDNRPSGSLSGLSLTSLAEECIHQPCQTFEENSSVLLSYGNNFRPTEFSDVSSPDFSDCSSPTDYDCESSPGCTDYSPAGFTGFDLPRLTEKTSINLRECPNSPKLSNFFDETLCHLNSDTSVYLSDDSLDELDELLSNTQTASPSDGALDELYQLPAGAHSVTVRIPHLSRLSSKMRA